MPRSRHREERSDVAIHTGVRLRHGLPRYARKDERGYVFMLPLRKALSSQQ